MLKIRLGLGEANLSRQRGRDVREQRVSDNRKVLVLWECETKEQDALRAQIVDFIDA
jgi:G:T-mismatch repair DNA endonuclease (very short patch repair protein)